MATLLRILLYPLVAVVSLLLFSLILFPYDSLKFRLAHELEVAMGSRYSISIGEFSPSFPIKASLKDVRLKPVGAAEDNVVVLKTAKVGLALLPLISGHRALNVDLHTATGKANGAVAWFGSDIDLDLSFDRFDIRTLQGLLAMQSVALDGQLTGKIDLELSLQDPQRNEGQVRLQFSDLKVIPQTMTLPFIGLINIPEVQFAKPDANPGILSFAFKQGNIEVTEIHFAGADINLQLEGKVFGAKTWDNYRFNLKGALQSSETLTQKVPYIQFFDKEKTPEGVYPFFITGKWTKPSLRVGDSKIL